MNAVIQLFQDYFAALLQFIKDMFQVFIPDKGTDDAE